MAKMPETIFVVEGEADGATHMASAAKKDVVTSIHEPTVVGTYKLVKTEAYISAEIVRKVKMPDA